MANSTASGYTRLAESGIDGLALKPTEVDVAALAHEDIVDAREALAANPLIVDYEGDEVMPDRETLADLAARTGTLRVTTPVRADAFDPLRDDGRDQSDRIPEAVGRVFVAGHPAYLSERERRRAVAPRLRAVVEAAEDPWVGTEGVERVALTVGGTQFELLTPTVERDVRALRAAGFDGEIALYAPTVLSEDEDGILDAVGDYVARRPEVTEALPDGAPTNASATGEARGVLSEAAREYALVGDVATVRERTDALRQAGVDYVVAYPAAGIASLLD